MKNSSPIVVEYPYSELYNKGYLYTEPDFGDRIIAILSNTDTNTKKSVPYSRYLISTKLKRFLRTEEQVFHIDGNKLNNDINNLQIKIIKKRVSKSDNPDLEYKEISCTFCQKVFTRQVYQIKPNNFCSTKCRQDFCKRQKISNARNVFPKVNSHNSLHKDPLNYQSNSPCTFVKLEGPFKDKYETARLIPNKSLKTPLIKFKKIGETEYTDTIGLHRYLLSIKLGRILNRTEKVIYIDGDSNNISINNLTVKSELLAWPTN